MREPSTNTCQTTSGYLQCRWVCFHLLLDGSHKLMQCHTWPLRMCQPGCPFQVQLALS